MIGAVILGIEILQLLGDRNEKGIVFLFVALAVAAVTARTMGLLGELSVDPGAADRRRQFGPPAPTLHGPVSAARVAAATSSPARGRRTSRGGPTAPLPQPPPPSAQAAADQAELDAILDKISEFGMDGLSGAEKRVSTSSPSGCAAAADGLRQPGGRWCADPPTQALKRRSAGH